MRYSSHSHEQRIRFDHTEGTANMFLMLPTMSSITFCLNFVMELVKEELAFELKESCWHDDLENHRVYQGQNACPECPSIKVHLNTHMFVAHVCSEMLFPYTLLYAQIFVGREMSKIKFYTLRTNVYHVFLSI